MSMIPMAILSDDEMIAFDFTVSEFKAGHFTDLQAQAMYDQFARQWRRKANKRKAQRRARTGR